MGGGGGGGFNPLDTLKTITKGIRDVGDEIGRATDGSGIHLDPFVKQKQALKDETKQARRDQKRALERQEKARQDAIRQREANASASKGATVLLGDKGRSGKGTSVSSSMGLKKGNTGLQT